MSTASHRVVVTAAHLIRGTVSTQRTVTGWTCLSCRVKQHTSATQPKIAWRSLSTSPARWQGDTQQTSNGLTPAARSTSLPSHTAKQRSAFTKRVSEITDSILARASVAGQHINTYTGTDYSGIEALRRDIIEQETEVKTQHTTVTAAKARHREARAKQAASQKEIVALLERKPSWSPGDLERYMSLMRSEHAEDQTVQRAAEELAVAERELEGTRSLLEKLERKQYHEEQIWSDTIRRNSTWVTIGLMGANIVLLLAQISIFEPYRRRKIVKQIEQALDERTALVSQAVDIPRQIDLVVEPEGVTLEELEIQSPLETVSAETQALPEIVLEPPKTAIPAEDYIEHARLVVLDLFSDRVVSLKQVDITTLVLEGAAAGLAIAGAIAMIILRSTH